MIPYDHPQTNYETLSNHYRNRAKGYPKHSHRIPQGYNPKNGKIALYTIYT